MRLLERTLRRIAVAPRQAMQDALGAQIEGFSERRMPVRASVIPSAGGLVERETGLCRTQTMCLLMPLDTEIAVGDGVCVDSDAPEWRCVSLQRWSAHIAAQVERLQAP